MNRPRWNCWFSNRWSWGRWVAFDLWPAVHFDWIIGNGSFHIEVKWLLWEFKLNTFWRKD